MMPTDSENPFQQGGLLIKIANGDREALRELYEMYREPVYMYAMSIVKNRTVAEEVMQDVFVSIMRYKKLSSVRNERAWIFTVVRNQALHTLKKEQQESGLLSLSEDTPSPPPEDPPGEIEALSILDDTQRQIITLYIYGGFSQKEIARITGLPYIKVRSKYGYAIRKLKKYYSERGIGNG